MPANFVDQQPGSLWRRRLIAIVSVVLIIGVGIGIKSALKATRKPPKKKPAKITGLLVKVLQAKQSDHQVLLTGHGQAQPRREVSIVPQVSGKVVAVHPQLVAGGVVRAGQTLLRIDPVDYRLNVEQARAAVATAQQKLAVEESSGKVARQEWKLLGSQVAKGEPSPLTLREPQLKSARAALDGAKAQLKMAQLGLSRTSLRAPFNMRIRQETVEVGQYVAATREVASAFGTDTVEVVVPVKASDLKWLDLPVASAGGKARPSRTTVEVLQDTGEGKVKRPARLVRSMGEIDSSSRLSRVVVAIDDPYNLKAGAPTLPPLQVGSFVEVSMLGERLRGVVSIPNEALRIGSKVWVAGPDDKLQVRKVTVARLTSDQVLISAGLNQGDRVITTAISGAVDGMLLRVQGATPSGKEPAKEGAMLKGRAEAPAAKGAKRTARP